MFCAHRLFVNSNHAQILEVTYTSMRLDRFEESTDMVVVARNNDRRALFDVQWHALSITASARVLSATDFHLLCLLHSKTMSQAIGNVYLFLSNRNDLCSPGYPLRLPWPTLACGTMSMPRNASLESLLSALRLFSWASTSLYTIPVVCSSC